MNMLLTMECGEVDKYDSATPTGSISC